MRGEPIVAGYNVDEFQFHVAKMSGSALDPQATIVASFHDEQSANACAAELHRRTGDDYITFAFAELEAKA